jgi:diacylglycerol O-acyltransferase
LRQLTSLDAQFLAFETPRQFGHVSGLAICDPSTAPGGYVELEDLQALIAERLPLLPPFRWRLAEVPLGLDYPYWIDDSGFDLDFHVRELALPPPGTDAKLAEQTARIFSRPLDRSRPLWELYLIHGLEGGRIAILTKIHHSVVDGVSGAEILGALLDLSPEGRPPPDVPIAGADRDPSDMEMLARGVARLPGFPIRAIRSLGTTLPNIDDIRIFSEIPGARRLGKATWRIQQALRREGRQLERPELKAPRTTFNGRISAHRRFAFGQLSLDAVKRVKDQYEGYTVNDVVVALCTTAVRRWLIEHNELPDEPLVAQIPMSVRTSEQMGTYGNRISIMSVPVFTNEADPHERLRLTHEALRAAKEHHRALPAELLQDAAQFIPPAVFARAARATTSLSSSRGRPPWNFVISNVPGPQFPLYCAGARLEANYPVSVILDGLGLNMTVMSYCGHLDFGLVADREQMPDVWNLMGWLGEALDELEPPKAKRSNAKPKAKPKASAKPKSNSKPKTPAKAPAG